MLEGLEAKKESYPYFVCPVCGMTVERGAPEKCPVCGMFVARYPDWVAGVRFAASLYENRQLARVARHPFPAAFTPRMRAAMAVNAKNAVVMAALGWLLDGPEALRETLLSKAITLGTDLKALLADEDFRAAAQAQGDWRLDGHTLVVTLEPCCHHGRTPPCTESIINAGISSFRMSASKS
mgnify:CR=1 FL=1